MSGVMREKIKLYTARGKAALFPEIIVGNANERTVGRTPSELSCTRSRSNTVTTHARQ